MAKDFGVSMNDATLEHKLNGGKELNGNYCFWTFAKGVPEGIEEGSKMWVANRARWIGYFVIHSQIDYLNEVHFHSESFVKTDKGERSPFQGYTWNVPGCEQ